MRSTTVPTLLCTLLCIAPAGAIGTSADAPNFTKLGALPGTGPPTVTAELFSSDGSAVVGRSRRQPFRWTRESGTQALPLAATEAVLDFSDLAADGSVLVGDEIYQFFEVDGVRWSEESGLLVRIGYALSPTAVTPDGGVLVATDFFDANQFSGPTRALRIEEGSGRVDLGALLETESGGGADPEAISDDGAVVTGNSWDGVGWIAYRWTAETGMVALGDLPGGLYRSNGTLLSANGAVVVGESDSVDGPEVFRWTEESGLVGLGDLPGGEFSSRAAAVSTDGSVVVGTGTSAAGDEAFRWTTEGGMEGLGNLPGAEFESFATCVSADGAVVVGASHTDGGTEAFVWTARDGMRRVEDVLVEDHGIDVTAWRLTSAIGISADGRTIAGNGVSPRGNERAWVAVILLPEPGAQVGSLAAAAALGLLRRLGHAQLVGRRRQRCLRGYGP